MANWNRKIAEFAKDRKEEESDVDKELQSMAKSGAYGYEQPDYDRNSAVKNKAMYQSYDQESTGQATDKTPIMNEAKDNYDAIDPEREFDDDGYNNNKEEKPTDAPDEPVTRRMVIELIVCILAFIGRGLCLNSVGPTLIDLRQIASMTIPQSAWIFVSQSIGFLIGSVLAKIILQRFNNALALSICLASQALCSALIPAFRSIVMMCIMFIGQGFSIGVVGIGVCSACIRLGGKTRNGMFLQAVYLGVSIGSVLGPFIARPFLSSLAKHADNHQIEQPTGLGTILRDEHSPNGNLKQKRDVSSLDPASQVFPQTTAQFNIMSNTTTQSMFSSEDSFTQTHVRYYYVIMATILCIPAAAFFILYIKRDKTKKHTRDEESKSESLNIADCSVPLTAALALMFTQCFLYFGMQDTYSNLLTTFSVLGPLQMSKTNGVYLTSLFWASMCFGRLNGIWIAKLISPFKMLLIDMAAGGIAAMALMLFAAKSSAVLWGFTSVLGLSFATINGATVSWAARHLPGNNYVLSLIMVGRCVGLLTLPTTTTALFKVCGPMTLMYTLFLVVILMLTALISAQTLAHRFGIDDRLHTKSQLKKMADNTDSDSNS